MSKSIRVHLGNGKNTYCGIVINKSLSIAVKGELFFESEGKTIRFNCLCKNCVSIMVKKSNIYRNYIERVKVNESVIDYEEKLPKSIRAMKAYCAKRKLNWNNKNTKAIDKLQVKVNPAIKLAIEKPDMSIPIDPITNKPVSKTILNQYVNTGNQSIEETAITAEEEIIELVNPIEIGEKTIKGKARELRKQGLLPIINWKQIPEAIDRIEDGHPIAIVRGFNNTWKVIEEFCSINNCKNSNVRELTGWVDIQLARKTYNQAIINRVME